MPVKQQPIFDGSHFRESEIIQQVYFSSKISIKLEAPCIFA